MNNRLDKILFFLYFLTLGLVSAITQMILLREVLTSFRGNELFLTYFLIIWLVLVGLGTFLPGLKWKNSRSGFSNGSAFWLGVYYLLISLLIIGLFLIIRAWPALFHFSSEAPQIFYSFLSLPLIIFPVALLFGFGFSFGGRYFSGLVSDNKILNINLAYLMETGGFFLGSLIFNFWLIKLSAFKLILLLVVWCLLLNLLILISRHLKKTAKIFCLSFNFLAILTAGWFLIKGADFYDDRTAAWRVPTENLVINHNSVFNNILVTAKAGQYNFYQSGSLVAPARNFQASEESIHWPLLFTSRPQRILIIGEAWNGYLTEALKYPDLKIVYTELDPDFLPTIYDFLSSDQRRELQTPRLQIVNQDAYSYLQDNREKFDLILSNLPPPATYQLNRYYTREFFVLARKNLNSQGVLAFSLPYQPENFTNRRLNQPLYAILNPLQQVFPNNFLLPGQKLILLGFNDSKFAWSADNLVAAFTQKNIPTKFISAAYLKYLLTDGRTREILAFPEKSAVLTNSLFQPRAVIYQLISRLELNDTGLAGIIDWLLTYRLLILIILLLLPLAIIRLIRKKTDASWPEARLKIIAALGSSLSLVWEIIIIFVWQISFGYIYQTISLIIGLVMLGIFLANLQLYCRTKIDRVRALKYFLGSLTVFTLLFLIYLVTADFYPVWLNKAILLIFSGLIGYFGGTIYPLANYLYLQKKTAPEEAAGQIYAWELVGGGLTLTIFSLFILPFNGFWILIFSLLYWSLLIFSLTIYKRREEDRH